jgi:hypothetical protein
MSGGTGSATAVSWEGGDHAACDAAIARLTAKVADYENGISWNTSCTSCARVLDSSYRDHARAEKAELVVAAVRGYATDLGTPMDVRITLKRMLADAGVEVAP